MILYHCKVRGNILHIQILREYKIIIQILRDYNIICCKMKGKNLHIQKVEGQSEGFCPNCGGKVTPLGVRESLKNNFNFFYKLKKFVKIFLKLI